MGILMAAKSDKSVSFYSPGMFTQLRVMLVGNLQKAIVSIKCKRAQCALTTTSLNDAGRITSNPPISMNFQKTILLRACCDVTR